MTAIPVYSPVIYTRAVGWLRDHQGLVRVHPLRIVLALGIHRRSLTHLGVQGGMSNGEIEDILYRTYSKSAPFDGAMGPTAFLQLFGNINIMRQGANDWRNGIASQKGIGCFATEAELRDPVFRAAERPQCLHRKVIASGGDDEGFCELSPTRSGARTVCRSMVQHAGEAPKLLQQAAVDGGHYTYKWVEPPGPDLAKLLSSTSQRIPALPLLASLYCGSEELNRGRGVVSIDEMRDDLGFGREVDTIITDTTNAAGNQELAKLTEPYLLASLRRQLWEEGFAVSLADLVNFYLSLKPRAFVILSGVSGNGKSQLPRRLADKIRHPDTPIGSNFQLLPVRSNWNDVTDLLGFFNALQEGFEPGVALDAIAKATRGVDDDGRYATVALLDEMNLSRVEHYFSDFLSIMETRTLRDGAWVSDPIRLAGGRTGSIRYVGSPGATADFVDSVPAELPIPDNLFFVGTVNIDESTRGISRKVLDRANTIEVELPPRSAHPPPAPTGYREAELHVLAHLLADRPYRTAALAEAARPFESEIAVKWLDELNDLLRSWGAQFGRRVYDEVCMYLAYAADFIDQAEGTGVDIEEFSLVHAFDRQVLQKILPRIAGTREELENAPAGNLFEALRTYLGQKDLRLSAEKLARMRRQEIVNFWEA